jgi:hypothetical protein
MKGRKDSYIFELVVMLKRPLQLSNIDYERAGDFVLMADEKSWFTYYFWLDDSRAPDYGSVLGIHKKPGDDPVELFMTSKARAANSFRCHAG